MNFASGRRRRRGSYQGLGEGDDLLGNAEADQNGITDEVHVQVNLFFPQLSYIGQK